MISARIEDYLEEIFLIESTGRDITVTDLAERLGITKGTVTAAVQKMVDAELLNHERYGALHLTAPGRLKGLLVYRRHEGLRAFFHELLGVDRERASEMACDMEHYIDSVTDERLYSMIEFFRGARADKEPWISDLFAATESRVLLPNPLSVFESGQSGIVTHLTAESALRGRLRNEGFVVGAAVLCLESGADDVLLINITPPKGKGAPEERSISRKDAATVWLRTK
ncbi:DtxR family transcriptional regulator [Synergistales bacterium]|nr:DtxR family transcriptional regulator [Synergistales bacterium]